jgi:hypothetical protein
MHAPPRLSPNVAALGYVSMLTAMSSAMIYGLLPVYMVRVLGISIAAVGFIEGIAEAVNSLIKIVSGTSSDWIGRRKPLVVFAKEIRGEGFGLRLALAIAGFVVGPLIAIDGAPDRLRGTAFGIYDVAIGVGTFVGVLEPALFA